MIRRLRSLLTRAKAVATSTAAAARPPAPTLAQELRGQHTALSTWVAARRHAPGRLYSSLSDQAIGDVMRHCPDQLHATIAAADRVCKHEFDLLGSGPYRPVDPTRAPRHGYQPIDWYLDPVLNLRFPERVPYKSWNLMEMRPGLADVKHPWELGRCQHWMPLAQAFACTRDERYATEILDQFDDFIEANPVGFGVQWTCTMDVALRALNWSQALELIQGRSMAPAQRVEKLYASLFDTGHFIERNLENTYEVTSNHFLSNIVGLFGVGVIFGELPSGARWMLHCREWLEEEMKVQVLADGADYESSVPYHRLVAELFLSGWLTAHKTGTPLSNAYRDKLRRMFTFLEGVLRPDGKLPQIGDADDGRVHVFSDYGRWDPHDARHLFAPASVLFGFDAWPANGDPWAIWEAAWWGMSLAAPGPSAARPEATLFPDAGLASVRTADAYLLIANAKVGTNGFGNHKHNDLLSFEFHHRGQPLIVDPGSYVYTSNPDARNAFRSTSAHNTISVDGEEQNEFKTEWLFRMFEKAKPEHLEFRNDRERAHYRGRHNGYERLAAPVTHERAFDLHHATGLLEVADTLTGSGPHVVEWAFHCANGVAAEGHAPGAVRLSAGGREWILRSLEGLEPELADFWYSPSYGVRFPARVIRFRRDVVVDAGPVFRFSIEPNA